MYFKVHMVFGYVLFIQCVSPKGFNSKNYRWDRVDCENNTVHCESYECALRLPGRHQQVVDLGCNLRRSHSDLRVHMKLYYRFQTGYKPFLIDIDEDFCAAMSSLLDKRKSHTPTLTFFMPKIMSYSNINHTCPYSGNVIVRNLDLPTVVMRDFIPSGQYMFTWRVYLGLSNQTVIFPKFRFSFIDKGVDGYSLG